MVKSLGIAWLIGSSISGLTRQKSKHWQGWDPFWRLWSRICFKLIQIVSQIKFCALVGLKFLLPCWSSTGMGGRESYLASRACLHFLARGPLPHLQSQQWQIKSSHLKSLRPPPSASAVLLTLLSSSTFNHSYDHMGPTWIIQGNVPILKSIN